MDIKAFLLELPLPVQKAIMKIVNAVAKLIGMINMLPPQARAAFAKGVWHTVVKILKDAKQDNTARREKIRAILCKAFKIESF